MGILDRLFSGSPRGPGAALLGRWRVTSADEELDLGEGVQLEFRRGGRLRYTRYAGGRERTARLAYRVEGDQLITDRPLALERTRTTFALLRREVLVLDFGGSRAWCERVKG